MTDEKNPEHYIHNPDFVKALTEYQEDCRKAVERGEETPSPTDYIGECIIKIAEHLATSRNFSGYSYRDEMILDGIENAIKYGLHNFNVEKTSNAFGYFSRIMYWAYVRRIKKEQKQLYVKHKVTQNAVITGMAVSQSDHSNHSGSDFIDMDNDYMNSFVERYEENLESKKTKTSEKVGLEKFVDD